MKNWLVIPARAGSSLSGKNTRLLGGKPLFEWVYDIAQDYLCTCLNVEIIVTSDIPTILDYAETLGDIADKRPIHLRDATVRIEDVLLDLCIRTSPPKIITLLQPTSPFISFDDIQCCIKTLQTNPEVNSCMTLIPVRHNDHAYNQRCLGQENIVSALFPTARQDYPRKQDKPQTYKFGNCVSVRLSALFEHKSVFAAPCMGHLTPWYRAIDIDIEEDFELAELIVKGGLL